METSTKRLNTEITNKVEMMLSLAVKETRLRM